MASAIYILDLKGKTLIFRDYRGDIPHNVIDKFVKRVIKEEEEEDVRPVFEEGGYSFCHIKHMNLYCKYCSRTDDSFNFSPIIFLRQQINLKNLFISFDNNNSCNGDQVQCKCGNAAVVPPWINQRI